MVSGLKARFHEVPQNDAIAELAKNPVRILLEKGVQDGCKG
jgi:hypothetical protein